MNCGHVGGGEPGGRGGAVGLDVGTSEVLSNSEGCLLQSCGCAGGWLDEFL